MLKLDARKGTIRVLDGRKVLAKVPTILTPTAIEGVIAGADLELPLDELVASLVAAVEEAARRKGSVVPYDYRLKYGADQCCGDTVAYRLTELVTDPVLGVDLAKVRDIAVANEQEPRLDAWLAKGLNPGMIRMNLGNVLRGMIRRGEAVHGL